MSVNLNQLKKVPVFCIITGIFFIPISLLLFTKFALVYQDGGLNLNSIRYFLLYGTLFVITLFIGGKKVFHNMTRKDIFLSASVLLLYGIILLLFQGVFHIFTDPLDNSFRFLYLPFAWCDIIRIMMCQLIDKFNWFTVIPELFAPYLFILFGKKAS